MALVHEAFPDKNLLFTEGCNEAFDFNKIHEWRLCERYGESMIHDFNNGTVGRTDWNLLLDDHGGPNHLGNFCLAPIHANTQTVNKFLPILTITSASFQNLFMLVLRELSAHRAEVLYKRQLSGMKMEPSLQ